MKGESSQARWVVTADQRHSRTTPDAVPQALESLASIDTVLAFERTAGDEIQALLAEPSAVVATVITLSRSSQWRIGIGHGAVEAPLPTSTREARGTAYLAARDAVHQARRAPGGISLIDADASPSAPIAEAVLQLIRALLLRRTPEGWAACDLVDRGLTVTATGEKLGVSASAISQRLSAAAHGEVARGAAAAVYLLQEVDA